MKRGILAIDPGGTTGIAWAEVDIDEGIMSREHEGSRTVDGSEYTQIVEICHLWSIFYKRCVQEHRMPADQVDIVCEDFSPRPGRGHTDEGIMPVRLIWGIIGYRLGQLHEYDRGGWGPAYSPDMIMQSASQAATFATDARLKSWGLWIRGREHERSAWRHLAFRAKKLQQIHKAAGG